ncbi:rod shape-determining protein [Micromonospora sp. C28SCA-DRY-2]|uniref:rod shape-determining protein n=1 Tax=Micromonospora sp. C28SCA-DRY-2 TaxID=3059522 RepID=UPI002676C3CF|nr:rod shape-determining protein [Micromonospora sp. C28SCA-DRY-2]MDO3703361.1 rod shape-determining protein [Micromonospora sp. C28SCA-DRY-2]
MPARTTVDRPQPGARRGPVTADRGTGPALLAVDAGSSHLRLWGLGRGTVSVPTGGGPGQGAPLVRRGRLVDAPACTSALRQLLHRFRPPVEAEPFVVACRPVSATPADEYAMREVLTAALAPRRLLFIDTLRAAAIGAGAAAGALLLADIGAQVTEIGLLDDGQLVAARRTDFGTRDITDGAAVHVLATVAARLVREIYQQPAVRPTALAALARGMVLVGDGAARPDLIAALSQTLRIAVQPAAAPYTAALTGAGLAAMAAARHPRGGRAAPLAATPTGAP